MQFQKVMLALLFCTSITAQDASAQFCTAATPHPIPTPSTCVTGQDGTKISSLPATISLPGTYCLDVSPPSNNLGGITITTDNVTLDGKNHRIYGPISMTDRQGVTVRNIVSSSYIEILGDLPTANITVANSTFQNNGGDALNSEAVNGLTVTNSNFTCACDQVNFNAQTDDMCVLIAPHEHSPDPVDHLIFEGNYVNSDCVKTFKVVGGSVADAPILTQNIRNNTFINRRNNIGNEVSNVTWRMVAGNTNADDSLRNQFTNNVLISEGRAAGMYIRDDLDNAVFKDNCIEVKNPLDLGMFYGAFLLSGGMDPPSTDPGGLHFIGNRFYSRTTPALYVQVLEEDPANRNIFKNNLFASGSDNAVYHQGDIGALWQHNTLYSAGTQSMAFSYDHGTMKSDAEFDDNIFVCNNVKDGTRNYCFTIPTSASYTYIGNNNLFYNLTSRTADVYLGGSLSLANWITAGKEHNSLGLDPRFVDIANFNFHLGVGSPAIGAGTLLPGTNIKSDIGAFPYSHDATPPAAPTNLQVH